MGHLTEPMAGWAELVTRLIGEECLEKAIIAVTIALTLSYQGTAPSDADWEWLERNREQALEQLMPLRSNPTQLVAYRSLRDLYQELHEVHFTISFGDGPSPGSRQLTASVTVPVGRSIKQQLLDLHVGDRQAPLKSLLSHVSVRRLTVDQERCPALHTRVAAISSISIPTPDDATIAIHPDLHRIVIDMGGEHIDATLIDSSSAIVRWAIDTTDTLKACGAKQALADQTASSQKAGTARAREGIIRAASLTNGSFGRIWELTIERGNSGSVRTVSGPGEKPTERRFTLLPTQRQAISRAVDEAKFAELPERLGPDTVQLDGPENWLEIESGNRVHRVRLDDPRSAKGSDVERFRRVWRAVVEVSPITPPIR